MASAFFNIFPFFSKITEKVALSSSQVCGESFKNEGVAKAHLRSSHTLSEEKQFLCRKCGAMFKSEKDCRTHLQKQHLKAMKLLETSPAAGSNKKAGLDLIDSPAMRRGKAGHKKAKKTPKVEPRDPKVCCRVCDKDCKTVPFLRLHLKEHVKADQLICKARTPDPF